MLPEVYYYEEQDSHPCHQTKHIIRFVKQIFAFFKGGKQHVARHNTTRSLARPLDITTARFACVWLQLPDVCYSWWVLTSLRIIGRMHWIDQDKLTTFILACQVRTSRARAGGLCIRLCSKPCLMALG